MGIISAELRKLDQTGNPIFLNFDERVNLLIGPNATGKTSILQEIAKVFSSAAQGDNPTLNISENFKEALHLYIPAVRVSLGENAISGQFPKKSINGITTKGKRFFTAYYISPDDFEMYAYRGLSEEVYPTYQQWVTVQGLPGSGGISAEIIDMWRKDRITGVALTENAWDAINKVYNGEMSIGELKQIQGKVDPEYDTLGSVDDDDLINALTYFRSAYLKEATESFVNYTSFEGDNVRVVHDLFSRMMNSAAPNRDDFMKLMNVAYSCAKTICPETIQGDFPHEIGTGNLRSVGIATSDNTAGGRYGRNPLDLRVLSSGTQGTFLWIWALAAAMAAHYHWDSDWEEKPAILLIDEIENHLHPTWQRRVIPALLEHFPGLQIFATTHSPFVVAGLKAGQVHLLQRDENGVTATTNTEDVIGWTADEILRTMMGVDDPTDDATAAAARELRQLRQETPRSAPADEERRQQRIQELRQQVDRDLLAGGPMAAQRELFEEQFAEIMQRYHRNRELNQENG